MRRREGDQVPTREDSNPSTKTPVPRRNRRPHCPDRSSHESCGGGFLKFRSGQLKIIWDEFIKCPEDWQLNWYKKGVVHHKYYGEQNFINWMCDTHKINLTLMPAEWVCKLTNNEEEDRENNIHYMKRFKKDYMILDKPNDDIKIVHFANPTANIHTSKYDWIKDYWK